VTVEIRVRQRVARSLRQLVRTSAARFRDDTIVGAPNEHPEHVARVLEAAGIPVDEWRIPEDGYRRYLRSAPYPDYYHRGPTGPDKFLGEKTLEHYVSLELAGATPTDVLIDVASHGGPFKDIARAITECGVYEQDLQFRHGIDGARIGGNAAAMPVPDGFANVMTLHCSFDHFEGSDDSGFVRESGRVLAPGGRVVILPLYLSDRFGAKVDPRLRLRGLGLNRGMCRFLMPGLGVRFSRVYDPVQLGERVLCPAEKAGLQWRLLRVRGARELVPGAYLNFALLLTRPPSTTTQIVRGIVTL
jgi:hypothetical protein